MVVGREFPTASGDILDVLQSISGSSGTYCVMSCTKTISFLMQTCSLVCFHLRVGAQMTPSTLRLWKRGMYPVKFTAPIHVHSSPNIFFGSRMLWHSRFHHYDCLVVPVSSITTTFPWEKVTLLVEYEPLGSSLFSGGCPPDTLRLRQWVALKTAREISASALARSGTIHM